MKNGMNETLDIISHYLINNANLNYFVFVLVLPLLVIFLQMQRLLFIVLMSGLTKVKLLLPTKWPKKFELLVGL